MGWNIDNFIRKKKKNCVQAKQNKEFIHYSPCAGKYLAISLKAGLQVATAELVARQMPQLQTYLLTPDFTAEHGMFTPIFTAEYDDMCYEILLLVSSDQLSQLCTRPLGKMRTCWSGPRGTWWNTWYFWCSGLVQGKILSNYWGFFVMAFFPSSFSGITIL